VPVVDLAEIVRVKVHDELAAMNGRLEQLVAEAVDRELDRLVRDLVQARLKERDGELPPPTKVCIGCGQGKPLHAFQPGRNQCRRCRNRAQSEAKKRRRRQSAEEPAVPFSGSGSPSGDSAEDAPSSTAPSPS
jgi:hypothetical protein